MARRTKRASSAGAGRFLVLIAAILVIWGLGLVRFADSIPDAVADKTTKTDAIVVLTGGSGRLEAGIDLLAREMAGHLFVSGVYHGVDVERLVQLSKRQPENLEPRIGIGDAVNTVGNAKETADWMAKNGYSSLRLVTAAYHMPRSLAEFHHAMPAVTVVPNPVFPEHVKQDDWWAYPGTASLVISEYNKWLFARARQGLAYLFAPVPGQG